MPSLTELLAQSLNQPTAQSNAGGNSSLADLLRAMSPQMTQKIPDGVDPSWYRNDGTRKGMGFLGPLRGKDGRTTTELSIGVNLGGKEMDIPSIVPTLHPLEVQHLLNGGDMTDAIVQKAVDHAQMRMKQGKSPFAD